ncbi:hypothetical protein SLEP1_g537 [Rubroshorea leprosula]|uniref:DOMON domain-containing protein n=1 Tax=Rubroshorea leprosula TaxID=152421 RepID=A0AAV5HGQ2_9ROSI|nr:hypothetical protein SLEP1_g537 [Rubroshorea leprosula]
MASVSFPSLILFLFLYWVSLISPIYSLSCTSDKLSNTKIQYPNCTDLSTLNATLHYSYNVATSSLSIAFLAAPAKPEGWVAWALNPTGSGMVGAQALIAFKSNSSLIVKKYSITSYSKIEETNILAFDVSDLRAEAGADGKFVIYATVKVPEKAELVNMVWQVGGMVAQGHPMRHAMSDENLKAKGALQLVATSGAGNRDSFMGLLLIGFFFLFSASFLI